VNQVIKKLGINPRKVEYFSDINAICIGRYCPQTDMIYLNLAQIDSSEEAFFVLLHEYCHQVCTKQKIFSNYHHTNNHISTTKCVKFLKEWIDAEQYVDLLAGFIAWEYFNVEYSFDYLDENCFGMQSIILTVENTLEIPCIFRRFRKEFNEYLADFS
jgi:hypothetical protein